MINRFSVRNKNTEEYHRAQAFSIYMSSMNPAQRRNQLRSLINRSFFAGRQWIFEDDIELFLKDESANIRNRIRFVHNIIKPIVRQFVGNAIRTSFDYSVMATSQQAQTRMENKLNELLSLTDMQKALPNFAETLRKEFPIGETREETTKTFNVSYRDEYAVALNYLLASIHDANEFEKLKVAITENLALDGAGILFEEEYNQEQVFSVIKLKDFIFDVTAKNSDLSDAAYKGHSCLMTPPSVGEGYNLPNKKMREIEDRVRLNGLMSMTQRQNHDGYVGLYSYAEQTGKVPVVKLYWDDISVKRYGCFLDPYGYEVIKEISEDPESPFQEKDLIQPKQKSLKEFFKGKLIYTHITTETRYCHFIPASFMCSAGETPKETDVCVLKYGVLEFSNSDSLFKTKAYFPYSTYCWKYDEGEILSPIDDVVDPQRYYNRIMSVSEAQVNNSSLSGAVIDKNAVAGTDGGEEQVVRSMTNGQPIFIDAPEGIHNAIGRYNSNVGDGAFNLHKIGADVKANTLESAGVNENMQGTGGGYRVSANVVASNIQQGTLMQEDFYFALSSILKDAAISMIKRGKMIYLKNEKKLSVRVGDNFARVIELSKEMAVEEFRLIVRRTTNISDMIAAGEERALFYLQNQLIDSKVFAKIFGNSTPSEVDYAMRKYQYEKDLAEQNLAKQQKMAAADGARANLLSAEASNLQKKISDDKKSQATQTAADARLIEALASKDANVVAPAQE